MKQAKESAFVVGNIGNPYTSVVSETRKDSVIVAEMSSFQLETVHTFRPKVSAILNIYTGSSEPSSYDGSLY